MFLTDEECKELLGQALAQAEQELKEAKKTDRYILIAIGVALVIIIACATLSCLA